MIGETNLAETNPAAPPGHRGSFRSMNFLRRSAGHRYNEEINSWLISSVEPFRGMDHKLFVG